mmetsp:Transcript_118105/g.217388  ORF Transcript_118105/g.217388 Transcript_118105/m.217388 type:complete len:549 (+) Transcript_118105:106-1752(+)
MWQNWWQMQVGKVPPKLPAKRTVPQMSGAIPAWPGAQKMARTSVSTFKRVFLEKQEDMSLEERQMMDQARADLDIVVDGGENEAGCSYPPVTTFEELTMLPMYALLALLEMEITAPMPIQAQALPIILGGNDLVGVARTGSGKTLAFLLPAVVHIEAQTPLQAGAMTPIMLALAPTRELAVQISAEAQKLLQFSSDGSNHPGGLRASCVYGGLGKAEQLRNCKGAHIIAATPGRLADHIQKGEIRMDRVTYFVLDEGDRMLDDGFEWEVKGIGSAIRKDRQMLFFSATWPKKVQDLAKSMCQGSQRPVRLCIGQSSDGSATTRQDIIQEVVVFDQETWDEREQKKQELLYTHVRQALEMEGTQVLVFVSTKTLADTMVEQIRNEGFTADAMHGGRPQDQRLEVLERFKRVEVRLLVTTNVMGRGLDIPTISHVVIYDMGDIEDYVHRIGRCCRGPYGHGHALTLFEYNQKWPHLAEGLIKCLESAGQIVPDDLQSIANEVANGQREVKAMKAGSKWGALSGWQGSADNVTWKKMGYGPAASGSTFHAW